MYVVVGNDGKLSKSSDGTTWESAITVGSSSINWWKVTYGDDKWVLAGTSGYHTVSKDCENWSTPTALTFNSIAYSLVYGNSTWLASDDDEVITATTYDYGIADACIYLSNLLDNLTAPSGETMPTSEPLSTVQYVTGDLIYNSTTYTLNKLRVRGYDIYFIDTLGNSYEITLNTDLSSALQITDLVILESATDNGITGLIPLNGDSSGYIGTSTKRFAQGYFDNIDSTNIDGTNLDVTNGTIDDLDSTSATITTADITSLILPFDTTIHNDYVELANGLVIAWGGEYVSTNSKEEFTFPNGAFSSRPTFATGSDWSASGSGGWSPCGGYASISNYSKYYLWNVSNSLQMYVSWIAIGY